MMSTRKRTLAESIMSWLASNYELASGVCLPRSLLYQHYLDSCQRSALTPIGAAAFGKLVRRQFHTITTRRLGTRGQSKYHYYGLAVKPGSPYYTQPSQHQPTNLPSFSIFKSKRPTQHRIPSGCFLPKTKTKRPRAAPQVPPLTSPPELDLNQNQTSSIGTNVGNLLKNFPVIDELMVPSFVPADKLATFLLMYRAYNERLLESFCANRYEEVSHYVDHFWTSIPNHLLSLLDLQYTADVVECYDNLFYETLESILIPMPTHGLTDSIVANLRCIENFLFSWCQQISYVVPIAISEAKTRALKEFQKAIKRHLALAPFICSCRMVSSQSQAQIQMSYDMSNIDLTGVFEDIDLFAEPIGKDLNGLIEHMCRLDSTPLISDLLSRVKHLIENFLRGQYATCLMNKGCMLLLTLSRALNSLARELTLMKAQSFGYWHLFFVVINDYALLTLESELRKESASVKRASLTTQQQCNPSFDSTYDEQFILQLL